jgi:hypothetical protein
MPQLHVGLILPNYGEALGAERLASAATAAEEAGFDSGWVTDHLIVPTEHASVYGTIAESLVSLAFSRPGPDASSSASPHSSSRSATRSSRSSSSRRSTCSRADAS